MPGSGYIALREAQFMARIQGPDPHQVLAREPFPIWYITVGRVFPGVQKATGNLGYRPPTLLSNMLTVVPGLHTAPLVLAIPSQGPASPAEASWKRGRGGSLLALSRGEKRQRETETERERERPSWANRHPKDALTPHIPADCVAS